MNRQPPPSELTTAIRAIRPYLTRAFGFALVAGVLALASTFYMFEVYDRVVNSRNALTLAMLTLVVLFVFGVMEVLEWARAETLREAGVELDRRLSNRVYQAAHASSRLRGAMLQPISDLLALREMLCTPAVAAVMEAPLALVFTALIFAISPVLGWAAIAGAIVQVSLGWINERSTRPPLVAANRSAMAAHVQAEGLMRNAEVIEAMGMLPDIHRRWRSRQFEGMELQAVASERAGVFQALTKFVQNTMGSLLLGLGAWLLLHDELHGGGGMLIVGSVLGGRLLAPVVQLVMQWPSVINAISAWGRLDQLLAEFPAKAPSMALPAPRGELAVEQVTAGAPGGGGAILKGIAFSLQPGEALIVVGPSGAGKSSLARVLTGLWSTAVGKVRLDGVDVHAWDKLELGAHLGYLPQNIGLLDGTIAENIARFGVVQPALVEAAAKAVGLHEMILSLPQGYDTSIGREGAVLSGGQRQRVALARAIYGNPVLVVLDEPNSSLDEAGDAGLAKAIETLKAQGTSFVVMTHRTSVLAVADKMLVLRDGTQQFFGSRDEVIAALGKGAAQTLQVKSP